MCELIAFTGAHGTGKTTATHGKVIELKVAHPNKSVGGLFDLESDCPYPINKETSREAQIWIFTNQINHELYKLSRFDIVVADRTIIDVIAYTMVAGFDDLAADMVSFAGNYMSIYRQIVFKQISRNEFCHADGIRESDDRRFRAKVESALKDLYDSVLPELFGQVGSFKYA